MIGVELSHRVRNEVIREECGVKEDVVTKHEKNMWRWFSHVERIDRWKDIDKRDLWSGFMAMM
jgi:hypothetical protein